MPRTILPGAASVAALALAGVWSAASAQPPPGPRPADPALLDRGRYLVETAAFCGACHDTFGEGMRPVLGMAFAGGRVFAERGFRAVAPNITPDPETGIGRWTDAEIAGAIRDGRRPDGSLIGPPMPVESYRGVSDRDLAAMVTYLRTVPPVRHAVAERSRYPFDLAPHGPPVASVPDPPEDDPVKRGEYLAVNVAHCMDCHSAQISEGRPRADLGAARQAGQARPADLHPLAAAPGVAAGATTPRGAPVAACAPHPPSPRGRRWKGSS